MHRLDTATFLFQHEGHVLMPKYCREPEERCKFLLGIHRSGVWELDISLACLRSRRLSAGSGTCEAYLENSQQRPDCCLNKLLFSFPGKGAHGLVVYISFGSWHGVFCWAGELEIDEALARGCMHLESCLWYLGVVPLFWGRDPVPCQLRWAVGVWVRGNRRKPVQPFNLWNMTFGSPLQRIRQRSRKHMWHGHKALCVRLEVRQMSLRDAVAPATSFHPEPQPQPSPWFLQFLNGCGSKPMGSHFGVGEFATNFRTYFYRGQAKGTRSQMSRPWLHGVSLFPGCESSSRKCRR